MSENRGTYREQVMSNPDTASPWNLRRLRQQRQKRTRWLAAGLVLLLLGVVLLVVNLERPEESLGTADLCADSEPLPDQDRDDSGSDDRSVQLNQEFSSGDKVGGYHLFTRGVDFDEPVGVLVRLHGDGAAEYASPEGLVSCLAEVAASHNMILLAPLSPDRTDDRTWWGDIPGNLPWLLALVNDRVLEAYPVDGDDVWWMGYSGGAEMISYGLLQRAPQVVTGGAIMVGGGGAPSQPRAEPAQAQLESLPLFWITGTEDDGTTSAAPFDAVEAAQQGSAWYRSQGFQQVSVTLSEGHDHFSLPQAQILDDSLAQEARG